MNQEISKKSYKNLRNSLSIFKTEIHFNYISGFTNPFVFLKAYSEPLLHNVFRLVDHLCQAEHLDTSQLRNSFHTCGN